MFHLTKKGNAVPDRSNIREQRPQKAQHKRSELNNEQTEVQRYVQSQDEKAYKTSIANQNNTSSSMTSNNTLNNSATTQTNNHMKEVKTMNNPQSKDSSQPQSQPASAAQTQGRVDIPGQSGPSGQNFHRPGAPSNPQASRPAYPGSTYPGSQAAGSSYNPQANDRAESTGPKLVIGQGITLSGEIEACDHLIVEGTIEASLKGASLLEVAESGSYFGTVEIEEANIAGRFEGDITVKGRLTIESTGTIIGTISYKELSMEAGATLDGSVSPIGSENAGRAASKKPAPSKSKKATGNSGAELPFSDRAAAE